MDFKEVKEKYESKIYILSIILIGFIARIVAIKLNKGFFIDVNAYKKCSEIIFETGFFSIGAAEALERVSPLYLFVLYIVGFIKDVFNLGFDSKVFTFLIKLTPMIFDVLTSVFLFKIIKSKLKPHIAFFISLAYCINPAIMQVSATWGEYDSIYTFFVFVSIYYLTEKKYLQASNLFAIAILCRQQAIYFLTIYIYFFIIYLMREKNTREKAKKIAVGALSFIAIILIGTLPYTKDFNIKPIVNAYIHSFSAYPYASVNAYNFYSAIGKNWIPSSKVLMLVSYKTLSTIFVEIIFYFVFVMIDRNNKKSNVFFMAAVLNVLIFMFCVHMHERYLYSSLIFFIAAYAFEADRRIFALYSAFSVMFYINCADIMRMAERGFKIDVIKNNLRPISFINLILTALMILTAFFVFKKQKRAEQIEEGEEVGEVALEEYVVEQNEPLARITKKDYIYCAVIMLLYGIIAFYNLGNTKSVQSFYEFKKDESIVVDFGKNYKIDKMQFMPGVPHEQKFQLSFSYDGENYSVRDKDFVKAVFAWKDLDLNRETRYVKITSLSDNLKFMEVAFRSNGELVPITNVKNELFDEQELVPERNDYLNSTYFDEIYHARTGYEFLHGLKVYEWTHPPLGKDILSIGIKLFGMTPFGWRFMGTLFGVLMILPVYLFGKRMFGGSKWAIVTALIFSFDFMHFVQTRLATIDTYITLFVICMYYFMYLYLRTDYIEDDFKNAIKYLFLSGLFMGLGIASKWPGIYAASGLCTLFFLCIYRRVNEYIRLQKEGYSFFLPNYFKQINTTILLCFIFFVFVPVVIYLLSYTMFLQAPDQHGLKSIIKNQIDMYNYHSKLKSTHPYEATWWKWVLDIRPIYYYANDLGNNIKQGISSFGNPAVWWGGFAGFIYCSYLFLIKKDKTAEFLIIAYLAQLLPWLFIPRTTYIYHYFPSVAFITLMLVYMFKNLFCKKSMKPIYTYVAIVIFLFAIFYPVLSGMPIDTSFVKSFLKWLPGWQLI